MINYSGIWQGEYRNDNPADDQPVAFTIQIQHSILTNKILGEVWEDMYRGIPGCGTINGTVKHLEIDFYKYMPNYYCEDQGQLISLKEYWKKQFEIELVYNPPHPPLHYQGHFEPHTGEMEGKWSFLNVVQVAYDIHGNSYDIYTEEQLTGTWTARRANRD
jgi:hypothetical protein